MPHTLPIGGPARSSARDVLRLRSFPPQLPVGVDVVNRRLAEAAGAAQPGWQNDIFWVCCESDFALGVTVGSV